MRGFSTAAMFATMAVITDYLNVDMTPLGISQEDKELTFGDETWLGSDRHRVSRGIQALIFGTLEAEGIRLTKVPSEFIAAVLAVAVHPKNQMKACIWLQEYGLQGTKAQELVVGSTLSVVRSEELFALIFMCAESSNTGLFRQRLLTAMQVELKKSGVQEDEAA